MELTAEGEGPFEPMKPIEFAARAEPWKHDLEYRYHFGDGPPTGWLRDSRYPHTYAGPGSYQVFVEVRPAQRPGAGQDAVRSNVLPVRVLRKEERGTAPPSTNDSRVRPSVTVPPAETKAERAAARPELRHPPPTTSDDRVPARAVAPPGEPRLQERTARLDVRPQEAQTGEPVRFQVFVEPHTEGLGFSFDFGDGQASPRQAETVAEHRYTSPGTYGALVKVYREDRVVAESKPAPVTVSPQPEHRLLLEATTRNPEVGDRVRLMWRVEPPLEGVLYLVDFGDGESVWVPQAATEHAYARPGEYRILVRARIGGGEIRSNDLVVAVRAADQGPFYLLITLASGAALALVVAWRVIVRLRRRKRARRANETSPMSSVVVKPHGDPGTQVVVSEVQDAAGPEIRLNPVIDKGQQVMEQGLIIRANRGQS